MPPQVSVQVSTGDTVETMKAVVDPQEATFAEPVGLDVVSIGAVKAADAFGLALRTAGD